MKIKKIMYACLASLLAISAVGFSACVNNTPTSDNASSSSSIESEVGNDGSISISLSRIELDVDEEYTLTATATPSDATIVWTVADPSVAVVENGKVRGVANGETTVYASTGEYVKAACKVVVKQKYIADYAVVLSTEETQIGVGDEFTLSATVKFGNMDVTKPKFTWTSSNETVATVTSKGVITGLTAGTTIITAEFKTPNGETVKAQCVLHVI